MSNGFPTGFKPVKLVLADGEEERPNGLVGEGPSGTGCGFGGATVNRSRSTRLARLALLVPRNWASIFGSGCWERENSNTHNAPRTLG